uniref:Histone H4 n=1 Tax=Alexandrium catenella TaxID=2925 RepID=A0A7S1S822_ALECA|mmetsp:Transcript_89116/g.236779  ORF Transcript_89116/g.236779 Transcript_89116/m.236779 type:complete len:197 (+) Transcript_89116:36-626(+)
MAKSLPRQVLPKPAQVLRPELRAAVRKALAPPPPVLGAEVRATDVEQLKKGLAIIACLAKGIRPAPEDLPSGLPRPERLPPTRELRQARASVRERRAPVREVRLGKGGAKRTQKVIRERTAGITQADMRRLARRAGCQRVAQTIYEEARSALSGFLEKVLKDVTVYTEYARRKTASPQDVILSLRRQGRIMYGRGH